MGKKKAPPVDGRSILDGVLDEYALSEHEYYTLYSFFVTYSLCKKQSNKKRTLRDYGHPYVQIVKSGVRKSLQSVLRIEKKKGEETCFIFSEAKSRPKNFTKINLGDGALSDYDKERAVLPKDSEQNQYFILFHHVRNGLAHGQFALVFSSTGEKMVVMEDKTRTGNVNARIVLKLNTLLSLVATIDKRHLIV